MASGLGVPVEIVIIALVSFACQTQRRVQALYSHCKTLHG